MSFDPYARRVPVVVRMNPHTIAALGLYAKCLGITRSALVNILIQQSMPAGVIQQKAVVPRNAFENPLKYLDNLVGQLHAPW